MAEKVKLTREQADRIEKFVTRSSGLIAIKQHLNKEWTTDVNLCLVELSDLDFIKAVVNGYEVEPEYKVGDWVVFRNISGQTIITNVIAVQYENNRIQFDSVSDWQPIGYVVRHATPEEIKAEKERRVWAKTGREVGEFRDGDFVINSQDVLIRVDSDNKAIRISERYSNRETFKGFFPSESFISFEGLEGDSDD